MMQFSENFTIALFHYDGRLNEWDEFEWSRRAIHISTRKQTKWCVYSISFVHTSLPRTSENLEKIYNLITSLSLSLSRWYAKRFLHPDIVAAYEYIFIWDEDLGVEQFNAEEYASYFIKKFFASSQYINLS
jgi:Protein of unknown function (DUF707)